MAAGETISLEELLKVVKNKSSIEIEKLQELFKNGLQEEELCNKLKKVTINEMMPGNEDTLLHIAGNNKPSKIFELLLQKGGKDMKNEDIYRAVKHVLDAEPQLKETEDKPPKDGRNMLNGPLYQLKLLMLYLYRGVYKDYSFYLTTEDTTFGKFDDLVFRYTTKNGSVEYRLLQAKHKENEKNNNITTDGLLADKGDFSLMKYFLSYQKLKKESIDGVIKDITICTNTDFNINCNSFIEEIAEPDDILDVKCSKKQPKRYRFNNDIKNKLKSANLASRLAKCITSGIRTDDGILKPYQALLAKEVINVKAKTFHNNFLEGIELSEGAMKFKQDLENGLGSPLTDYIKNKNIKKLNISKNFGTFEEGLETNWPTYTYSDDDLNDYFDHLVFAVNQPNENELGEIIEKEIGKKFNLGCIKTEIAYNHFFMKMLNWFQGKIKHKFLSHSDGKEFIETTLKWLPIRFDVQDPVWQFTGRLSELEDLATKIKRGSKNTTVISQITAISGLGGIGKTQLARQFIKNNLEHYDNILWINAENKATLAESFKRLAKGRLGLYLEYADETEEHIKNIVDKVYTFFEESTSLFVFDNAEYSEYLQDFLPKTSLNSVKLYVLITSRVSEWSEGIEVLKLGVLNMEEGVDFIKNSLSIEDNSQDPQIIKLLEKLHCFPLAIQQAISYMKYENETRKFGVIQYLHVYDKETKKLLDSPKFRGIGNDYTKTTYTTWNITLNKIKLNENGNLALEIINVIAYFQPDNIYRNVFFKLTDGNEDKVIEAVRLLVKYSMLNGEHRQSVLNIHRLVQEVIRLSIRDENIENEVLEKALSLFKDEADFKSHNLFLNHMFLYTTDILQKNVDHAVSVWDYAIEKLNKNEFLKKFNYLPFLIVRQLYDDQRYQEAYSFGNNSIDLLKGVFGTQHVNVVAMMWNMKEVLIIQEKWSDALEVLSQFRQDDYLRETISGILGDEVLQFISLQMLLLLSYLERDVESKIIFNDLYNEDVVIIAHDLSQNKSFLADNAWFDRDELNGFKAQRFIMPALKFDFDYKWLTAFFSRYKMLGTNETALCMVRKFYEYLKISFGKNHPTTLTAYYYIAEILNEQKKYDDALEIAIDIDRKREQIYDSNNLLLLQGKELIALILLKQTKFECSLNIYEEIYKKRVDVQGKGHKKTLIILLGVATLNKLLGKHNNALVQLEEAFEGLKMIWQPNNPFLLGILDEMGDTLHLLKRPEEALNKYEDVYERRLCTLGKGHDDTYRVLLKMAILNTQLCNHDRALLQWNEFFVETSKRIHSPDNARLLLIKNIIVILLVYLEKFEEALIETEKLYHRKVRSLGKNHEETLFLLLEKAKFNSKLDNHNDALTQFKESYAGHSKLLDPNDPKLLIIKQQISQELGYLHRFEESLKMYIEVYKKGVVIQGKEHDYTLNALYNMAILNSKLDNHETALIQFKKYYKRYSKKFDPADQNLLSIKLKIAEELQYLIRFKEALNILEEVSKEMEGKKNDKTLDVLMKIGLLQFLEGNRDESNLRNKEAFEIMKENLDPTDSYVHEDKFLDAFFKVKLEALNMYKQIYEKSVATLGKYNEDTLNVLYRLALLGDSGKAVVVFQEVLEGITKIPNPSPILLSIKYRIDNCLKQTRPQRESCVCCCCCC